VKKTVIGCSIILAILVIAGVVLIGFRGKKTVEFETAEVVVGDVSLAVNAAGTVFANREVEIKAKASGEIIELPFDVGDQVMKGDLLAKLDPVDEKRSLNRAEIETSATLARLLQARLDVQIKEEELKTNFARATAALNAAKSKAQDRRQKATRIRTLFENKLSSQEELDASVADATSATSDEENAQTRLLELKTDELTIERLKEQIKIVETEYDRVGISLLDAKQRLEETSIYSPIDGVVSTLNVQRGQIISSAISNVGGGTALMIVSDLSRILVYASVDESDIGRIHLGQEVRITADGFADEVFLGKVERMAVKGVEISNVVTFETRIEVVSENRLKLKPQMTVNASIIIEERKGVLVVPAESLLPLEEGYEVELKGTGDAKEKRNVTVGLSDGLVAEILSGLKEGEQVVKQGTVSSRWQASNQNSAAERKKVPPPPPPGLQ
jgi:HlyD family secretion protein